MMSRKNLLKFFLFLGDVFLIFGTLFLALGVRYGDFTFLPGPNTRDFIFHFLFVTPVWLVLLYLLDFYEIPPVKNIFYFFYNVFVFAFLAGLSAIVYFYVQPKRKITPKTILLLHVFLFSLFLLAERWSVSKILSLRNSKQKVKILGEGVSVSEKEIGKAGFKMVDRLEDAETVVVSPQFFKKRDVLKEKFRSLPLSLNYVRFSDFWEQVTKKVPVEKVDEPWFLENVSKREGKTEQILKRIFDIGFITLGLLVGAFLFPLIALAIKLESSGPIFYTQKRVGKKGKEFLLLKFRTMTTGAEKEGPQWAKKNDSRITNVGAFLRKTHLDEWPQFLNILKGDLSVVGPRPERPVFVEKLKKEIPFYDIRHMVKPGMAGWAQINYPYGSSIEDAKEKLRYDLYYIKHRSLALDASILLKTARIMVRDLLDLKI